MILVGLTGSIATGKSTVARIFEELGAVVIDADALARQAVAKGSEGLKRVVERFGPQVLTPAGELDRAAMRRLIFSDPAAKAELEGIVHPLVRAGEERLVETAVARDPQAVVIVDLPLLYEIDQAARYDKVIVVYLDRATQIERLIERDGVDRAAAEKALAAQMDIETKRRRADYVIDNRGPETETRRQTEQIFEELKALAQGRGPARLTNQRPSF